MACLVLKSAFALSKIFQSDSTAVFWVPDGDAVTKKRLYVRWPEGVTDSHIGLMRSV